MEEFKKIAWSWFRIFAAAVVSAFTYAVITTQAIPTDGKALIGLLVAGIVSVGPVIVNYLNKNDPRYGTGADPAVVNNDGKVADE